MAPTIHPRAAPSGQTVPPLGGSWDETTAMKDVARKGNSSPEEIIEISENASDKRKFEPLLFQAHRIIIGVAVFAILAFFFGWMFNPTH